MSTVKQCDGASNFGYGVEFTFRKPHARSETSLYGKREIPIDHNDGVY